MSAFAATVYVKLNHRGPNYPEREFHLCKDCKEQLAKFLSSDRAPAF